MYLKSTSAGSDPKPLTLNPTSPSHAARTFLRKYFFGWFFCSVCGPNRWVWCRFVKFLVPRRRSRAKYLLARVITTGHRIKKKCQRFFFRDCFHHKKAKKKSLFSAPACNQDWYLLIVFICFFLSPWFLVRFLSFDFRFVFKIVFEFTFRKLWLISRSGFVVCSLADN